MPSPALMTGLWAALAAIAAEPTSGMAQDDHIGVAFQRADGIRQALALRYRRVLHLVDRDDRAAQPFHGGGERRRGAGGWFVEQVGQDLALEQVKGADVVDHVVHLVRHGKDVFQVFAAELLDRDDILAIPGRILVVAEGQVGHVMFVDGHGNLLVW